LQAADAFVLPSSSENFGVAILEALAAGTPAVVSDQTPWKVLNEKGAGRWVRREAAAFAQAISDVLSLPAEERAVMSRAARAVAASFSWERIQGQLAEVYAEVIEEAKAAG
jgi:glycosyltransferase involved in cell wall biosynthesis